MDVISDLHNLALHAIRMDNHAAEPHKPQSSD